MDQNRIGIVSRLLLGGAILVVLGLIGGFLFANAAVMESAGAIAQTAILHRKPAGTPATFLFDASIVIGIIGALMMVAGLILGFVLGHESRATPQTIPECVVAARFAVNEADETIFSDFENLAAGGKMYVQLRLPNNTIREFQTAWGVFNACGEGLLGSAVVQGDWLSSFMPRISRGEEVKSWTGR